MLFKTHLALSLFAGLLILNYISGKTVFLAMLLLSSLIPDIDSANSYLNMKIKPINKLFLFLTKHRGIFHSITFCIFITVIMAIFSANLALPFFLGYSLHLLADSFTVEGIKAFWPSKIILKWRITTSGLTEKILFGLFFAADIILLIGMFK